MPGARAQKPQDPPYGLFFMLGRLSGLMADLIGDERHELLGKLRYWQHDIRDARGDGASRHRSVFGLLRVLNEDDAAGLLHRFYPQGAI